MTLTFFKKGQGADRADRPVRNSALLEAELVRLWILSRPPGSRAAGVKGKR